MGISLRTSDKITGKGKSSFCCSYSMEKVTLRLSVVILRTCGKASLRTKPNKKAGQEMETDRLLGGEPCLKLVFPLDFRFLS